jgi:hypothetical protein
MIIQFLLLSAVYAATMDDGILVLNDQNFDQELAKYDKILVEFYAPWW